MTSLKIKEVPFEGDKTLSVAFFEEVSTNKKVAYITLSSVTNCIGESPQALSRAAVRVGVKLPTDDKTFEKMCHDTRARFRHHSQQHYVNASDLNKIMSSTQMSQSKKAKVTAFARRVSALLDQEVNFIDVTCDACSATVQGTRYKCTVCPDYDECEACHAVSRHEHNTFNVLSPDGDIIAEAEPVEGPPPVARQLEPKNWPADVEYLNGLRVIEGARMRDIPLPPMHTSVELRNLPEGHPAAGKNESLGLFATERIRKPITRKMVTVIGYYAGVYRPDRTVPFNPYIMASYKGGDMVFDAFSCGNETRFINDHKGISASPNAVIADAQFIEGEAEWIVMRPIVLLRTVEAGEEITLAYGQDYWTVHDDWVGAVRENDPMEPMVVPLSPSVGDLVEVDMSQVQGLNQQQKEVHRNSVASATFLGQEDEDHIRVLISSLPGWVEMGPKVVPKTGFRFPPRGSGAQVEFQPGQDVECVLENFGAWWPATFVTKKDNGKALVIFKASFDGMAKQAVIDAHLIRDAPQSPPQKRRKSDPIVVDE